MINIFQNSLDKLLEGNNEGLFWIKNVKWCRYAKIIKLLMCTSRDTELNVYLEKYIQFCLIAINRWNDVITKLLTKVFF